MNMLLVTPKLTLAEQSSIITALNCMEDFYGQRDYVGFDTLPFYDLEKAISRLEISSRLWRGPWGQRCTDLAFRIKTINK